VASSLRIICPTILQVLDSKKKKGLFQNTPRLLFEKKKKSLSKKKKIENPPPPPPPTFLFDQLDIQ